MHRIVFPSLVLASLLLAASASAQDTPEPSAHHSHDRPYFHDGLYLRMAVGTGGVRWREQAGNDANTADASLSSAGGTAEVTLGGTPAPGFVVGATLLGFGANYADINDKAGSTKIDKTFGFAMLGATLDLFPDPKGGFHFGGSIGPAVATQTQDDRIARRWTTTGGAGVSFATGYDWWISRQWSLGFLVRATGARFWGSVTYDDVTDATTHEHSSRRSLGTVALLFTGLFH